MENNRHFGRWYICINFTLCMPTCNRNLMRRLLEHKTRINLLAETNSLLGRCLEFQKQSKFIKTLSLKSDMRILKAELKSEAFRYLPQKKQKKKKKKKKNIQLFIERLLEFSHHEILLIICELLEKKKKKKENQNYINQSEWRIFYHLLSCTNV